MDTAQDGEISRQPMAATVFLCCDVFYRSHHYQLLPSKLSLSFSFGEEHSPQLQVVGETPTTCSVDNLNGTLVSWHLHPKK